MRGDVIHISSRRGISTSSVIKTMTKFGKPLIIAVDVNPAPKNIERMSRSIGSVLFLPKTSMPTKDKSNIVKEFVKNYEKKFGIEIRFKSRHEKDALAAALKAWRNNRCLIRKVDNALRKEGLEDMFDEVVQMILKEESENITNAINALLKKKEKRGGRT